MGAVVAEVLVTFTEPTKSATGDLYYGRAIAKAVKDGTWEGWVEFVLAGADEVVTTARETSQPNRELMRYWAQGLSAVYLEGALERALHPAPARRPTSETRVLVDSSPRGEPQPEA
jgi:hypothetical protein